jgi:protein TonB
MVWSAAGIAGLRLQSDRSPVQAKEPSAVLAERMDIRLVGSSSAAPPKAREQAEPAQKAIPLPGPLIPQIAGLPAFPEPLLAKPDDAPDRPVQATVPTQHLTFGSGEGDKPPPEYPPEAKLARQQGTVVVRFRIDQAGHVIEAEATAPCPYSLLNQAAVRAVRETWEFPPGPARTYDVTFEFALH